MRYQSADLFNRVRTFEIGAKSRPEPVAYIARTRGGGSVDGGVEVILMTSAKRRKGTKSKNADRGIENVNMWRILPLALVYFSLGR